METVRPAKKSETIFTKLLATIMLCVLGTLIFVNAMKGIMILNFDINEGITSYYDSSVAFNLATQYAHNAAEAYFNNYEFHGDLGYNYRVEKNTEEGLVLVAENRHLAQTARDYAFGAWQDENKYIYISRTVESDDPVVVTVSLPMRADATESMERGMYAFDLAMGATKTVVPVLAVSSFLFIIVLVWLLSSSGHEYGYPGLKISFLDKIPLDVSTVALVLFEFCIMLVMKETVQDAHYRTLPYFIVAELIVGGLALLAWMMSFAVRVKAGRWWSDSVIYLILSVFWEIFKNISLVLRFVLLIVVYAIAALYFFSEHEIVPYLIISGLMALYLIWWAIKAKHVKDYGTAIAHGVTDYHINTERLPLDLKQHVESLSSIEQGINEAVDRQMKSEHMKTELITNVSHDIKTPLTSIISYVDLLNKKHTPEQEKQYLEVLSRQSDRLKKLTEDLIEASKASTGNISANLTAVDIREMLEQSLGEYEEKFAQKNLEIITVLSDEPLIARADGSLLWRVLNNVYSNITKYAMNNTRVYINGLRQENEIFLSIKNISDQQLNISADELMERFVQGDRSRHNEGSGLGLNIARSLMEIQQGEMNLSIDGDLFKVDLILKAY